MTCSRAISWIVAASALGCVAGALGAGSPAPETPSLGVLLDRYTQALDATQSFVSRWECTSLVSYRIPSWGMQANNERIFTEGEHRTDSRGRSYTRSYRWGYVAGPFQHLPRENARYSLNIIGADFVYRHRRTIGITTFRDSRGHTRPLSGNLDYRKKGTPGWDTPGSKHWGYFEKGDSVSALMGYFYTRARLDDVLKTARQISLHSTPAKINGATCYVVEADTTRGRFKVWFDADHGYHPARIRARVDVGDDIGESWSPHIITEAEGVIRDFTVDNVRFEQIDGVWVPIEADRKTRIILGSENGFSDTQLHLKRTKIILNPDHDAQGSFADPMENPELDPELRDGTEVNLNLGDGVKRTWLDGKPVADREGTPERTQ